MSTPIPTSNLTGLTDDDLGVTVLEGVVLGVEALVHLLNLLLLLYVIVNKNYPPLKIKQLPIVAGNYVSGIIWWLGGCASIRMFPQIESLVFLQCSLWTIWVQLVFGIFFWVSLLILRHWRLCAIVKLRNPFFTSWKGIVSALLVLWGPTVIYGIITTALNANGPIYVDQIYMCRFHLAAYSLSMAILGLYLVLFVVFCVILRNLKQKYLREYRETIVSFAVMVVFYVIYLIFLTLNLQRQPWGRCVCSFIITFIPSFVLYITIAKPAYQCMFHREQYEREFHDMVKNFGSSSTKGNSTTKETGMSLSQVDPQELQAKPDSVPFVIVSQ